MDTDEKSLPDDIALQEDRPVGKSKVIDGKEKGFSNAWFTLGDDVEETARDKANGAAGRRPSRELVRKIPKVQEKDEPSPNDETGGKGEDITWTRL